jgi:aquaporin Z
VSIAKRATAEFLGTFWLVFCGCGSAVLAAAFPNVGIGLAGVSLAFGLTVLTMAFAIGPISGCHLNPAVSVGLAVAGRFTWRELPGYVVAQCAGAVCGAGTLLIIASAKAGFDLYAGFASNGYGPHSPGGYPAGVCFLAEAVLTFFFLFVILGSTAKHGATTGPIAIGLCLTLIHLVSIPVTNTSVNPARSLGPAVYAGSWTLDQLWMFWIAPPLGAALAGLVWRWFAADTD